MGSTNFTPNYNLPQFIGTDKPAWLTDVNGAFSSIDTAIKNAADAAANASSVAGSASSAAAAAANTANTLDTQINTPSTGLAAVVSGHTSAITTIQSTLGTTALPTTAQTITGAIAETYGAIPAVSGALKLISSGSLDESYNGTKSYGQAMNNIYTALVNLIASLSAGQYVKLTAAVLLDGSTSVNFLVSPNLTAAPTTVDVRQTDVTATDTVFVQYQFSSSSFYRVSKLSAPTTDDRTSGTPASGTTKLFYEIYETLA